MSDGPHRSLPMRPAWKKLAERADKAAFSAEEVRDALPAALAEDWRKEIPDSIVWKVREILSDSQIDFFWIRGLKNSNYFGEKNLDAHFAVYS